MGAARLPRVVTELGVEKKCGKCQQWWPEDVEFFYRRKAGFDSWCRACYVETSANQRQRNYRPRTEEQRAKAREVYRLRRLDPEYVERLREVGRRSHRKRRTDPDLRARDNQRARERRRKGAA